MEEYKTKKGLGIHARKTIAYAVLILITFFCLIWFYILFVNASRSHGELTKGFTPIPSTFLIANWTNLLKGTLPEVKYTVSVDHRYPIPDDEETERQNDMSEVAQQVRSHKS